MFTILFSSFLNVDPDPTGKTPFDYGFPGLVMYATGMGTVNAAIFFAGEKKTGMLERLDTMPTGRKNLFIGILLSESIFISIQLGIMFVVGYGFIGVYFESFLSLLVGFFVSLLYGISSVGIGIMIASVSKTPETANGLSMMYYMPIIFISGSMFPFESPIVYFTPPYWAKQIYMQLTVMGHGFNESLYSSSLIGVSAEALAITLWGPL